MLFYIPRRSSFISTRFFVLNLDGLFGLLPNKFIIIWYSIGILLYKSYLINSFFGDVDLFFWYFCWFFICFWENLWIIFRFRTCYFIVVSLSYRVRNFITNLMASFFCCFLNYIFWSSFKCICSILLEWSIRFWLYLPVKFLLTFFTHIFSKRQNNPWSSTNIWSLGWIKYLTFSFTHHLISKNIFILSFVSSSLEFWSVNHTSIYEKSKLKVFENVKFFLVKYLIIGQMIYSKQMCTRLLNHSDNHCWQYYNGLILIQ